MPARQRRCRDTPTDALGEADRGAGGAAPCRHLRAAGAAARVRRAHRLEQRLPLLRPLAALAHRHRPRRRPREGARRPRAGGAAAHQRHDAARRDLLRQGAGADPRRHARTTKRRCWTSPRPAPPPTSNAGPRLAAGRSVAAAAQAESRHLHRQLSTWVDDDGMVVIRGRLTPEVGAVVQRALEAAADRLYREAQGAPKAERVADEVTPAQRRADALGLLAEAALTADLDRGTAGDRYQVVLHVEAADRCGGRGKVCRGRWKSTTARWTFPRKRRAACPATRRWWRCVMTPTARCSTSGARRAPCRRRSGARSRRATEAADSRAARRAAATPITSSTGSTAARPASTTSCCCAAAITGPCTKADSA